MLQMGEGHDKRKPGQYGQSLEVHLPTPSARIITTAWPQTCKMAVVIQPMPEDGVFSQDVGTPKTTLS